MDPIHHQNKKKVSALKSEILIKYKRVNQMDLTRETQRLFASQGDKTIYFNLVNMLVNLPPFANLYGECFFFPRMFTEHMWELTPTAKWSSSPKFFVIIFLKKRVLRWERLVQILILHHFFIIHRSCVLKKLFVETLESIVV